MSAAQSGPGAPTAVTVPHFPITLWGYERRYVDSFVTGLVKQLERERQRSDQAERALGQLKQDVEHGRAQVPAWFSSVGTEIDQVLDNAGRAAAKLLAEAGRRIQAATDAAEIQAADRLREAEEQVRKLEETARLVDPDARTVLIENAPGAGDKPATLDDAAAVRRRHGIPSAAPLVVYTGTFEAYQGLDLLFAAMALDRILLG